MAWIIVQFETYVIETYIPKDYRIALECMEDGVWRQERGVHVITEELELL